MLKFLTNLFKKKSPTVESILLYPEGKRFYKDSHSIRKNLIDEDALKIIHRLHKFNHKAFLVGGGVRDLLLGKKPKDFDIATSATPNQVKNIFNNCRIIGKRFKIAHIIFKNKIIEVSTFRSLPDHRLKKTTEDQDFLLRRDNNYGTAKEDAARRDFTINSLYFDPRNDSIIDFVGGFEDIKNKVLRVIGDPDVSFKEDPVRMLRAIKFQVIHDLEFDKKTKNAIKKNRFEMEKASTSRMLEEYNKIFRTWNSANIFKGLVENFIFEVLFKEVIEPLKRKNPKWQEEFFQTGIGKKLVIADRMLHEREELTSIIFFALLLSDVVAEALEREKNRQNMVVAIKSSLEPICTRLEIPKRDKDRLIKIFASQHRFRRTNEGNSKQNEIFRKKDFFYEAFMFFKINALSNNDENAVQNAFFWEISSKTRPRPSQKLIGGEGYDKFKNRRPERGDRGDRDRSRKKFNKRGQDFTGRQGNENRPQNSEEEINQSLQDEEIIQDELLEDMDEEAFIPDSELDNQVEESIDSETPESVPGKETHHIEKHTPHEISDKPNHKQGFNNNRKNFRKYNRYRGKFKKGRRGGEHRQNHSNQNPPKSSDSGSSGSSES